MFARSVPGVEDDRQVETLAHYVELRLGVNAQSITFGSIPDH